MTREEVLEKSRKENTVADEREVYVLTNANSIGGFVSIIVAMLLMTINEIADGPPVVNAAIWAIYWSRMAISYCYQAFHMKKKSYWFFASFNTLAAVLSIFMFLKATFDW